MSANDSVNNKKVSRQNLYHNQQANKSNSICCTITLWV